MEYRSLGKSGLKVSVIGLGTNQFGGKVDLDSTRRIIAAALEAGVNFLDTADVYQSGRSEEFIGQVLSGRRHQMLIATKVFGKTGEGPNDRGASRQHIMAGVQASLQRLQTDYIDLYQIHRWDSETPIEETMRALDDLVRSGSVRYIGASNFAAWQLVRANAVAELNAWDRFISIQPHFHLFERAVQREMLPACRALGLGVLPYFPLAGGFLTGKYRPDVPPPPGSRGEASPYIDRYRTPENFAILEKLEVFARERGRKLNELAQAWLLAHPEVSSVISGATRAEHVRANVAAADWELSGAVLDQINELISGGSAAGGRP